MTEHEIREKIAEFISGFKNWSEAREFVKDSYRYKADQILALIKEAGYVKLSNGQESHEETKTITTNTHEGLLGITLENYKDIWEEMAQKLYERYGKLHHNDHYEQISWPEIGNFVKDEYLADAKSFLSLLAPIFATRQAQEVEKAREKIAQRVLFTLDRFPNDVPYFVARDIKQALKGE